MGFAEGPGRDDHSWDKPLSKYRSLVGMWRSAALGMHYSARVYNTFVLSTLAFVWQLSDIPASVEEAEKDALRSLTPGPGMWRLPEDMFYLKDFFGQTLSFKSVRHVALAAKLRVAVLEDLRVEQRAADLETAMNATDHIDRLSRWWAWYQSSHIFCLARAVKQARSLGVDPYAIHAESWEIASTYLGGRPQTGQSKFAMWPHQLSPSSGCF